MVALAEASFSKLLKDGEHREIAAHAVAIEREEIALLRVHGYSIQEIARRGLGEKSHISTSFCRAAKSERGIVASKAASHRRPGSRSPAFASSMIF